MSETTQDVTARHPRPSLRVRRFTVLSAVADARASNVAPVTASLVVAVGVVVLVGWTFNVPVLKGLAGLIGMKANDAVGFVALGVSLLLTGGTTSGWRGRTARVLAAFTVVLGALTIVEYLSGHNLGLDQLLFRDARGVATVDPGRLAPQTAVIFVLLGVALILLNTVKTATSRVVRVFTGTSFVIAVFAVIGYAYGATGLVGIPSLSPIALHSAITILVLCVGIAAVDPTGVFVQLLTSDVSGSAAARTLLPLSVVVFPLLGWLEIHVGRHDLYSAATGTALLVLLSTVVLVLGVLSLTKRLTRLDLQRRTGAARELRLAALVDAASDAILSCDTGGIITSWNRAAERLYGYTEQEMIGHSVTELTPATELAEHRQMLKAVAQGESRNDVELQSVHRNGSLIDVSVTISKIMSDNSLVGFCGVAHSNTERLRARDELEERVLERTRDLVTSRAETLQMLAQAAEHRDDDTARHTERVGKSAARLAHQLGLPADLVELIGQAAPLHDVGKIGIPDRILLKPGRLTAEEFETMKQHTTLGASLLARSGAAVLKLGEQIALTHHERWDGNGYPNQLAGDVIPIAGRIVALVDSFDAMTNDRPYKTASSTEEALTEISRCSGKQFDPQVATAFLQMHHHAASNDDRQPRSSIRLLAGGTAAPQRSSWAKGLVANPVVSAP